MTTPSPVDPNQVRLTGENSFIRLHPAAGNPHTTRASHWRILLSPAGAGHVLFIKSELTEDKVKIYADNLALARWLQGEIETLLFKEFADLSLPVQPADFSREGDFRSAYSEIVESDEDTIYLTWHDFLEPFMLTVAAGSVPGRPHGVYSCFVPARQAQLMVNGSAATGQPLPEMRGSKPSTTACLAWSETWVRPA